MREVKITENGVEYTVKINKITYGVYNNIMQEVSSMKVIDNVSSGSLNIFLMRKRIVEASVSLPTGLRIETLSLSNGALLEHEALAENGLEEENGFFRINEKSD